MDRLTDRLTELYYNLDGNQEELKRLILLLLNIREAKLVKNKENNI